MADDAIEKELGVKVNEHLGWSRRFSPEVGEPGASEVILFQEVAVPVVAGFASFRRRWRMGRILSPLLARRTHQQSLSRQFEKSRPC